MGEGRERDSGVEEELIADVIPGIFIEVIFYSNILRWHCNIRHQWVRPCKTYCLTSLPLDSHQIVTSLRFCHCLRASSFPFSHSMSAYVRLATASLLFITKPILAAYL